MKSLIRPKSLKPGDKAAAVSLSWGGTSSLMERYRDAKRNLQDIFGLQVIETTHALKTADWIYNNPKARAEDLMEAFSDPSIKAIFTTIGGDDSIRTLPYIKYDVIRNNPKIFIGFSDSTVTHFACFKAGLTSFYGTSIMVGFGEYGGMHPYQVEDIRRILFSSKPCGKIQPNRDGWTAERIEWLSPTLIKTKRKLSPSKDWNYLQGSGKVQGRLLGGCMEVLELLKGTDCWPDKEEWKGCVLFLETSDETPPPDSFRRWLRNFAAQGILQSVNGILLGRLCNTSYTADYNKELMKILAEEGLSHLPAITEMDFGHTCPVFTLPYGADCEIDCDNKSFSLLGSGVKG
jgi:muramoyltetrapeptide carboxypeptidase LdcA involved in peptidoglycan recycling